jgi:isoleucyl-tRNA synthetase
MAELDSTGFLKMTISTGEITLAKEDVLIESQQREGFFTLTEGGVTVALSTTLTDELIEEGFVREITSKIQTMRKDSGFEVMDHINVYLTGNDKLAELVKKNAEQISRDVLAEDIKIGETADNSKEWDINGEKVTIGVVKL